MWLESSFIRTIMIEMEPNTLGKFLYLKRREARLPLRELADRLAISISHLSDIEHDRRFPSPELLAKIAKQFRVPLLDMKRFDGRIRISDLKRIVDDCPALRVVFKRMIDEVNQGKLTPDVIAKKLSASL
jgi:transcriptional regulator with XRE-family HTH domain